MTETNAGGAHNECSSSSICTEAPPPFAQVSSSSLVASTIALCVCMLAHSYLLISIFPYSGYMAIDLMDHVTPDTVGLYAGCLASAFMIGRASTSYHWGRTADRYGRKTVLLTSLALSSILSVAFGLSPNFSVALLTRFCLGMSNGIMGTLQTIVSELTSNEQVETTIMSTVMGFWGWGFLISPAISGALAEPLKQYGDSSTWLRDGGWLHQILEAYPFLMPNLFGAALCIIAMMVVSLHVPETLSEHAGQRPWLCLYDVSRRVQAWMPWHRGYAQVPKLGVNEEESECEHVTTEQTYISAETSLASMFAKPQIRACLAAFWLFSFVGLSVDEAFPLFCISQQAGFGLSEITIGKILSLCGLIFGISQYFVSGTVYRRFGLCGAVVAGASCSVPAMFLMPLSVLLNRGAESGQLNASTFIFLSTTMAWYRVFALSTFSNLSIVLNRNVPVSERATVNGITLLGMSFAQGMGPLFAGLLVSTSVSLGPINAACVIFWTIGALGCGVVVLTAQVMHVRNDKVAVSTEDNKGVFDVELTRPCNATAEKV